MRVAMVCPYSLSRPGGVQGQVLGLSRALGRLGHQVTVLAPDDDRPPDAVPGRGRGALGDGPPPVRPVALGHSTGLRSNGSVAPVSLSPAALARTGRWVRHLRPDVVHLHEPMAPVVGYGCLATHPAPLVGTYHRSGDSGWYRLLRPVAGWANRRLDAACAVSEAARDTARQAMGGDFRVLFNGVEIDRFAGATPEPTTGPTILFLGRHEHRKGLGVLLEAFDGLEGDPELWVAGDGPETAPLRRLHPDGPRRRWLGVLSEEQVATRLAGAHVLCAPSLHGESFGMVLLEAMAAGCAVVASDIPGYRAAAGGHATLVPPGDPVALREALARVLDQVASDRGVGSADARQEAEAHAREWSMERLARIYEGIYREVAASPGPPGTAR